jgi:nanoRNase/pAp phosphatase (c-di-AMP/oligoRNAs hydrolase)
VSLPETSNHAAQSDRAYLIVLNEPERLPASLRSGDRIIRRWTRDADPANEHLFTGDPTQPETYEWLRDAASVTAVIDIGPPPTAHAVLAALRAVRPDAAALLLSQESEDVFGPGDGTLARAGQLRDVLRLDLEDELVRLEAERRVHCLREFAAGAGTVPILIHADPDPDAVSSALAIAALLDGSPDRTPIVTLDEMKRPENERMAELLHIRVTCVTADELRGFDRLITVDTQPRDLQRNGRPRVAVIDHHPGENSYTADFLDIRPSYGATATIMTEYLRACGERAIPSGLATALLFGIKTDTDSLMRGVTAADVEAYAWLQQRADLQLIRRFERPSYSAETARAFGRALHEAQVEKDLCVAYLGQLVQDESHIMADLADFCLGMEHITWVAAAAQVGAEMVVTLRHAGGDPGAGGAARAIAALGGAGSKGGGHASMGRVVLSAAAAQELLGSVDPATAVRQLMRRVLDEAMVGAAATA